MVRAEKYRGEDGLDWYIEQPYCWDLLLEKETFPGNIWDPCCGMGQSLMALERAGYPRESLFGTDKVDRCTGNPLAWQGRLATGIDFLATPQPAPHRGRDAWATLYDTIFMNPPFGGGALALDFIRHALTLARSKVAAIASAKILGSGRRGQDWLSEELRPTTVYWYSNRPTMPPGDKWLAGGIERVSGGEIDYIALVWDLRLPRPPRPAFDWLWAPGHTLRRLGQPAGPLLKQMTDVGCIEGSARNARDPEADNG